MGSGASSFTSRGKPRQATAGVADPINVSPQQATIFSAQSAQKSPPRGGSSPHFNISGHTTGELYDGGDDLTERLLSGQVQQTPYQDSPCSEPGRSERSDGGEAAEMFAHTALSLGMDNEDLLFNLMYFGEGQNASLGALMEGVQQETLALHSENNTPYKLKPATANAIDGLHSRVFGVDLVGQDCECQVCKDEIEVEGPVLQIPTCQHYFHEECLLRWIKLQGWCPVCRAPIEVASSLRGDPAIEGIPEEMLTDCNGEPHNEFDAVTVTTSSKGPSMRLFDGGDEIIMSTGGHVDLHSERSPSGGSHGVEFVKPGSSNKCCV